MSMTVTSWASRHASDTSTRSYRRVDQELRVLFLHGNLKASLDYLIDSVSPKERNLSDALRHLFF